MPNFHRLGHLKDKPLVAIGQWVVRGQPIGRCGSSGASSGSHAHYDIITMAKDELLKLGYTFYVRYWSWAKVEQKFRDPKPFIKNGIPMENSLPYSGYRYMQPVRERLGTYYHPGTDINGANDYGKVVKSPVDGRVVFVSNPGPMDRVWKKVFGWVPYFKGWGWMVVIEQSPAFDIFHTVI
jgi:murein DD-endopeptidase MepM/ murein hydrolase activator NlpD